MPEAIINNTALRNNGDVGIVTALHDALKERGFGVVVATGQHSSPAIAHLAFETCADVRGYRSRIFRHIPVLGHLSAIFLLLFHREYRTADWIIGAPGGYINSYYGFQWKLTLYRWAKRFGKKTMIYAQSIGPLDDSDAAALADASQFLDCLVARDEISFETAERSGFPVAQLVRSPDAIFLREQKGSKPMATNKTVGFSVRTWGRDDRDRSRYEELVYSLVDVLLKRGFAVEFLSTCQGLAGYTDDSSFALELVKSRYADAKYEGRVSVDRRYLTLEELEENIRKFSMVIGTRLHMCLLAIINGVPAFNISYEIKGKECYDYLGYPQFSIDYNEDASEACQALELFLSCAENLRDELPEKVAHLRAQANKVLDDAIVRLKDGDGD